MEEDVLLRLRLVGEKKTSSLSDMTTTPAPRPRPALPRLVVSREGTAVTKNRAKLRTCIYTLKFLKIG